MFAQKTTGLLLECELAIEKGETVVIYKPEIDSRYAQLDIVSHDGLRASDLGVSVKTKPIEWSLDEFEIANLKRNDVSLVAIDEIQFFLQSNDIVKELLKQQINVVCSGLDLDSNGEPFGDMGSLLALADVVYKRKANCAICGMSAGRTFRKLSAPTNSTVLVGGKDLYEPRCVEHWLEGMAEWKTWTKTTTD